jgi:hypothetical protein
VLHHAKLRKGEKPVDDVSKSTIVKTSLNQKSVVCEDQTCMDPHSHHLCL